MTTYVTKPSDRLGDWCGLPVCLPATLNHDHASVRELYIGLDGDGGW